MQKIDTQYFNLLSPKTERRKIKLGLSRIKNAIIQLKNPCINTPAIQIIGTNGKGSITAFMENILYFAEINTGVTTSPHMFDVRERIRVNKKSINKIEFEKQFAYVMSEVEEFELSPFELIICCGLKYFDLKQVDLILLEAGLGGRLDATTGHRYRPIIAIGNIGLDHKEYLGNSIEKITQEKLAVVQNNSFVISCRQNRKVEEVINKKVKEVGAKIFWVNKLEANLELGLNGSFQRENAAVAVGVMNRLNKLGWHIKTGDIKKGLASTKWPGRLEMINWGENKILVDSAHNPSAAAALAKERNLWENQERGIYWILGVQKHKDISSIIKILVKPVDRVLLVPIPNQESWGINDLRYISDLEYENIIEFNSLIDALKYLDEIKIWGNYNPVITGSIFLVSEFLKLVKNFSK